MGWAAFWVIFSQTYPVAQGPDVMITIFVNFQRKKWRLSQKSML
jgi:hypothetical protein